MAIFAIIGLGIALQRRRPLAEQTVQELSFLVINLLLPFFLFYNTATTPPESLQQAPLIILFGFLTTLLSYGLGLVARHPAQVTGKQRSAFLFCSLRPNTGFLGIPLCTALFDSLGAVYAVLFDFGTGFLTFTLGMWELKGGQVDNWRPLFINPLFGAVCAGLVWAYLQLPLPLWLGQPFEIMSGAMLPMALLLSGTQLGNITSSRLEWWPQLTAVTAIRLLISPAIIATLLFLFNWTDTSAKVVILQAAAPVGLSTTLFAKTYGGDAEFAATASLWSTIACLITLPTIAFLLG